MPDTQARAALRAAAQAVMDSHRKGYWSAAEMDALEDALAALPDDGPTEPCPTCWQPVPIPQRGDHDYGLPLAALPDDGPSPPTSDGFAYPGQHDDCIATVPHFHARPYEAGQWSALPDDGRESSPSEP